MYFYSSGDCGSGGAEGQPGSQGGKRGHVRELRGAAAKIPPGLGLWRRILMIPRVFLIDLKWDQRRKKFYCDLSHSDWHAKEIFELDNKELHWFNNFIWIIVIWSFNLIIIEKQCLQMYKLSNIDYI